MEEKTDTDREKERERDKRENREGEKCRVAELKCEMLRLCVLYSRFLIPNQKSKSEIFASL